VTSSRLARFAWPALWLAAVLTWAHPTRAQTTGAIAGRVVNGTAGGPAAGSGLAVVLHVTEGETELAPLQATTDGQGGFRFEALDTDPELAYWPEVTYLDVAYSSSQSYSFAEGKTELEAALTVYETTADDGSVRVDSVHMIAESFEQVLRISEVHVFGNVGDRSYVGQVNEASGGKRVSVFLPVPDNAVGLAFPDDATGERFVQVEGGIWDTQAVPPGADTSVVRFSYHLLVEGAPVPLVREFTYPVTTLNVLVVEPGLALRGDQLLAGEPVTFQDKNYDVYQAEGLGPDTPLSIALIPSAASESTTLPSSAGTAAGALPAKQGQQEVLKWLGLGLAVLAAAGAVVYPLVTRPRTRA